MIMETPG